MFLTATLNGKLISYTKDTVFIIQVGRGKSAYKTRYSITGNLGQAMMYFNGINIGNGYKKRIFIPAFNKPVILRAFS